MKPFLLITLLTLTNSAIGQSFERDWTNFSIENWVVEFSEDSTFTPYIEVVKALGRVTFRVPESNSSITYIVYNLADVNDKFKSELEHWYSIQSCLLGFSPTTFIKNEYFYAIKACDKCGYSFLINGKKIESSESSNCSTLENELSKFLIE